MSGILVHSTKDADGNLLGFHDVNTQETLVRFNPIQFQDDFQGAGVVIPAAGAAVDGYPWVAQIVGAAPPTVAQVANDALGVIALTLTSASQAQTAALYWGDSLTWDLTKGVIFEARVALDALPSVSGVSATFGMQSAYAAPASVSYYTNFNVANTGAVSYQTKDGVNTVSTASGTTVTAGATVWHIYQIDCSDATHVVFKIDGSIVTSTAAFAATGANALVQPNFQMYKASGTGVGTMYVDYVKIFSNRA